DYGKRRSGCGEDRREPDRGGGNVDKDAGADAERRHRAGTPALGRAAADDVKRIGPWSQVQQQARQDEERKIVRAQHRETCHVTRLSTTSYLCVVTLASVLAVIALWRLRRAASLACIAASLSQSVTID